MAEKKGEIKVNIDSEIAEFGKKYAIIKEEISKGVVGQADAVEALIISLLANVNVLLEGFTGIAKTLMVRTLSTVMGCEFNRIQFTPDLLPTDIIGMTSYQPAKGFFIVKGPVFANFILADEINRAPPKVQSALLEAMQEKNVTIGKETLPLPVPFFVLATQNPLENLGTYPLPEAQVDRFLFKLNISYPDVDEEEIILDNNMTIHKFERFKITPILSAEEIVRLQGLTQKVYLDAKIKRYIVSIIDATRHPSKYKLKLAKYIDWGASPRASIGLYISSKAHALVNGKNFVTPHNVKEVAHNVLRHRIILNYEAQSENISTDDVIADILSKVPIP